MSELWGARRRFSLWRRLWVVLAESEQTLGLPITDEQLAAMRAVVDDVDLDAAAAHERRLRHDVMAHVHAFGDAAPAARGVIHWGATSCFVTDNADLILLREGLQLVARRLAGVIDALGVFAAQYRDLPCLAYTHLQPAQPTTVGKRACLWAYDLALDLEQVEATIAGLKARSIKGASGTQASFLQLFDGDHDQVMRLERLVADKLGFDASYAVTGQTYPRKVDAQLLDALAGVATSVHKAGSDLRLLQSWKEIEEPFEESQIGSSAMPYKRNPMRAERMCSLARFVLSLREGGGHTAAVQWMERTLDDSAVRRLMLPQAFLAIDAILVLYQNVASALVVYPRVIAARLAAELPFMASENLLMLAVAGGGDRQALHETIRTHSQAAAAEVKQQGRPNDLLDRLAADPAFAGVDVRAAADPAAYVGRAPQQVDAFLREIVEPIRARYAGSDALEAEVRV